MTSTDEAPSGDELDSGAVAVALVLGRSLMRGQTPHGPDRDAGLSFEDIASVPVTGPRRWWGGPLDVEGLALGSTRLAAASIAALIGGRGRISTSSARVAAAFDSLNRLRIQEPGGAGQPRASQGFAALSRLWPTADGWLRTHGNYPHHRAALLRALGVGEPGPLGPLASGEQAHDGAGSASAERVAGVLGGLTSAEAEHTILAGGGVAAALRSVTAWRASAAGIATAAELRSHGALELGSQETGALGVGALGVGALEGEAAASGGEAIPVPGPRWGPTPASRRGGGAPLAGLRVVELTRVIAGPTATRTLAALGAHVTRINPPHLPELLDSHLDTDAGKEVVELDLRSEAARVHALLAQSHVIVTGYRHQSLEPYGLDDEALARRHPHLVRASLSAWGPGPWQQRRGFDSLVQVGTGIAGLMRDDAGHPGALPVQALDHATGQLLVAGIGVALRRRAQSGAGGGVVRAALAWTAESLLRLEVPGRAPLGELDPVPSVAGTMPGLVAGTEPGLAAETEPGLAAETEPGTGLGVWAVPSSLDVDGEPASPQRWGGQRGQVHPSGGYQGVGPAL